jgi:hypothetical protein
MSHVPEERPDVREWFWDLLGFKLDDSSRKKIFGASKYYYQSVAPDGPSMPTPIKKEPWVAGEQEGQAGSPSYRQLGSTVGTVVG